MFIDASAIVAVLARESDWEGFATKIEGAKDAVTSPLAVWEAVVALTRANTTTIELAEDVVERFLDANDVRIIPITAAIGTLAIDASRRYGRGRHPANLNFGDCFAYACARDRGVPLLLKGEDFVRTDVPAA